MAIFDIRTIFMNCPPPSHSMRCFLLCVHFFGAIIESVRHLSFCKNRDVYGGDSEKKNGACFFVGVKERAPYIAFWSAPRSVLPTTFKILRACKPFFCFGILDRVQKITSCQI